MFFFHNECFTTCQYWKEQNWMTNPGDDQEVTQKQMQEYQLLPHCRERAWNWDLTDYTPYSGSQFGTSTGDQKCMLGKVTVRCWDLYVRRVCLWVSRVGHVLQHLQHNRVWMPSQRAFQDRQWRAWLDLVHTCSTKSKSCQMHQVCHRVEPRPYTKHPPFGYSRLIRSQTSLGRYQILCTRPQLALVCIRRGLWVTHLHFDENCTWLSEMKLKFLILQEKENFSVLWDEKVGFQCLPSE